MATFAELEYKNIVLTYILQHADQHESVHELYQIQNETNSVVSISETFEKKDCHQRTVEGNTIL